MTDARLLLDAAHFAAVRHRTQRRKGADASPYINHPLEVAALLAECGVDDAAVLAAALLHDTVEDTETTPDELAARFGARIAGLVAEVTDDKRLPKAERKRLQIVHAPQLSAGARLVKLADKICNVRDVTHHPPDWPHARRREYLAWAAAVVDGCRGSHAELETRFDAALAEGLALLDAGD